MTSENDVQATTAAIEQQAENSEEATEISVTGVNVLVFYGDGGSGQYVRLNGVRAMENLSYVRHMLSEFVETCVFTNYYFSKLGEPDEKLNDFLELATLVQEPKEGEPLTVKLAFYPDGYDVRRIRIHLQKVWEVITNPPSAVGSEIDDVACEIADPVPPIHPAPEQLFRIANLGNFYEQTVLKFNDMDATAQESLRIQQNLAKSITSVSLSSWNPPPPNRKLQGDLVYIEIVTATEGIFHVTATHRGFFVNKSTRQIFDPSPAATSHFNHDLLKLIESLSNSFRVSWKKLVENARTLSASTAADSAVESSESMAEGEGENETPDSANETKDSAASKDVDVNALTDAKRAMSVFAPLAAVFEQRKGEGFSAVPQWNMLAPTNDHRSDPLRMQAFICDSFGVDVNAAPRDWNEEAQSIKLVPSGTDAERISKSRFTERINGEFYEACKAAAVAVVEGSVAPLNPSDPPSSHVFVFNNIFFSRASDGKDAVKICKGDSAARKAAGHDLRSQQLLQGLDIKGLSSVLSCVVDYRGERLIAQTIIPGVLLQGVGAARLMFGSIEFGNRLSVKEEGLKLMKLIGEKFFLSPRNLPAVPVVVNGGNKTEVVDDELLLQQSSIRTDMDDEVVGADSPHVPHVGPLEAKLLRGADGRIYALEFLRLTPRDANYVPESHGGTGLIPSNSLDTGDKSLRCVYVLRHELIARYIENSVRERRQKILVDAATKQTSAEQPSADNAPVDAEEKTESANGTEMEAQMMAKLNAVTVNSVGEELQLSSNVFIEVLNESEDVPSQWLRSDIDETVASRDEETARDLARFLYSVMIPNLVHEVRVGEVVPVDGPSLVDVMHSRGINLRYLGRIAELASAQEKEDITLANENKQRVHSMPPYFLELVETELLARSLKHVINSILSSNEEAKAAPAFVISTILNHVLGTPSATPEGEVVSKEAAAPVVLKANKKKKKKKGGDQNADPADSESAEIGLGASLVKMYPREKVLEMVEAEAKARFLYVPLILRPLASAEDGDAGNQHHLMSLRLSRFAVLRRVCTLVGIRVASVDYDFALPQPIQVDNICGLFPVARGSSGLQAVPKEEYSDATVRGMIFASQRMITEGALMHAFEVAQEAHSWSQQISGNVSREMIMSLEQVANVLIAAGDLHQALNTSLRVLALTAHLTGLDSTETIQQHSRVAALLISYRKSLVATDSISKKAVDALAIAALQHLSTCKYLIEICCGIRHIGLVDVFRKMGMIYVDGEEYSMALTCLLEAKRRSCDLMLQAGLGQAIAEVLHLMGLLPQALAEQRTSHKMLSDILGPEDEKAVEAKNLVEKYLRATTEKNVKVYRQMQLQAEQAEALAASAAAMGKQVTNPGDAKIVSKSDATKKKQQSANHGHSKKKATKK